MEDFPPKCGRKRCVKMVVPNLSVFPYITIGKICDAVAILTVVYTERRDAIRIISARLATKQEKEAYYREDEY